MGAPSRDVKSDRRSHSNFGIEQGTARATRYPRTLALIIILSAALGSASSQAESLDKLADDFWTWRAKHAPFTGDDVNRLERPGGTRDCSRTEIDNQRKHLAEFEKRWKKIDTTGWPIPKHVDYRLIGSALSRVRWELDKIGRAHV